LLLFIGTNVAGKDRPLAWAPFLLVVDFKMAILRESMQRHNKNDLLSLFSLGMLLAFLAPMAALATGDKAKTCVDSLHDPTSSARGAANYNLEPWHFAMNRMIKLNDSNAPEFVIVPFEELQANVQSMPFDKERPGDGGGGNSDSFKSFYQGQPVHLKQSRFFEKHEIELFREMSRRNLAPKFYGLTKMNQQQTFSLVTELIAPVAVFKTFTTDNFEAAVERLRQETKAALQECPSCLPQWLQQMELLRDFFLANNIYVYDLQLMLLPDGRVLLYDFDLYTFYQASYSIDPFGQERSTLAVVKNAGRLLPYISCLMAVSGLITHFLVMFVHFLKRRRVFVS
jgi:hypothetical protein